VNGTDYNIPVAGTSSLAKLQIQGSGTTSGTTSLLVQNSAGNDALTVRDDGSAAISGTLTLTNGSQRFGANNVFINLINASKASVSSGLGLYLATNVGNGVGYSSVYMRNVTSLNPSSGSTIGLHLADVFAPTTGTAEYNSLLVAHTINQTGGANGITRGLYINPTLTAAFDFRAIEVTNGNVLIGNSASNTAKLSIKGSGTTSATTALLIQNSAGTAVLTVKDGGVDKVVVMPSAQIGSLEISGTAIAAGGGATISFPINRIFLGSGSVETSARLQVDSTTQGFLPPRMTTTEINAIASPATGLEVFNTTLNCTCFYNGTGWRQVTHTAM
jgi:hypothetical protein